MISTIKVIEQMRKARNIFSTFSKDVVTATELLGDVCDSLEEVIKDCEGDFFSIEGVPRSVVMPEDVLTISIEGEDLMHIKPAKKPMTFSRIDVIYYKNLSERTIIINFKEENEDKQTSGKA